MKASTHPEIRAHLTEHQDGLSVAEIANRTKLERNTIVHALRVMPDTYIDRWVERYHRPPHAIWCVVIPPEDCPKPPPKGTNNETKNRVGT